MHDTTSLWAGTGKLFQPLLTAALLLVASAYLAQWVNITNWLLLLAAGGTSLIIAAFLFWIFGIRPTDREEVWNTLLKIKLFKQK
jgi:hypothetical protein